MKIENNVLDSIIAKDMKYQYDRKVEILMEGKYKNYTNSSGGSLSKIS